jgi:MFS family permease
MVKNKKFAGYTIAFCILGVVFMFLYSGLQNDQINIIQNFTAWKNTDTQMPMTVGNFACIILTVIYGTCFIKFGVRKTLIPCIGVSALGCLGIVAANGLACMNSEALTVASHATNDPAVTGNYILFWISLFAVRCACMCLQMAGFQLAASWFIRYRGRVLGIVTLGSPLFSLIGTSAMTTFINRNLGGDYRPFYVGLAVLLVVVAILVVLFIRDTPEEVGLYPDGADHAPKSEAGDEIQLSMGEVLKQKKSWILICNYGAFQFVINACMGSMAAWFVSLCLGNMDKVAAGPMGEAMGNMGPAVLFVGQAVPWLSLGVLVGIGMSFIFGVIDDKLGTPIASLILGVTEFFPVIGLMMQAKSVAETGSCNVPMLVLWGFGVACMTGGVPTMHPASVSFMFGRREYQSANRVIMAIQLIPSAVAAMMMTVLIDNGMGTVGYGILLAVVVFGIITTLPMLKMKDANAEDRG